MKISTLIKYSTLLCVLCAAAWGSVSFSNLTHNSSSAATSSYATASVTPTANNIVLVSTVAHLVTGNGPGHVSSVSGDGLTWILWAGLDYGQAVGTAKANRAEVWCGVGASPSAGAITITWPTSPTGTVWSVDQSAGAAATCASALGITATNNADVATASPLTVTMGTFQRSTSATFGVGCVDLSGTSVGPGSGFTEVGFNTSGGGISIETEYATGNVSPVTTTYSGGPARWGILGVEVKVPSFQYRRTLMF